MLVPLEDPERRQALERALDGDAGVIGDLTRPGLSDRDRREDPKRVRAPAAPRTGRARRRRPGDWPGGRTGEAGSPAGRPLTPAIRFGPPTTLLLTAFSPIGSAVMSSRLLGATEGRSPGSRHGLSLTASPILRANGAPAACSTRTTHRTAGARTAPRVGRVRPSDGHQDAAPSVGRRHVAQRTPL
jgi:hypothetical protein